MPFATPKKEQLLSPPSPPPPDGPRTITRNHSRRCKTSWVSSHAWVRDNGSGVAVVSRGRDAAGKGGCIKRRARRTYPRVAGVVRASPSRPSGATVVFPAHTSTHLPAAGRDPAVRSAAGTKTAAWSNRVSASAARAAVFFFASWPDFERMLVDDGILLTKIWLNVGRANSCAAVYPTTARATR